MSLIVCKFRAGDLMPAVAGSAICLLTFMIAFIRQNPSWVGFELIIIILATYYVLPIYAVLWMAASALGGGAAAWLLRQPWREMDFLIWVPLMILIAFISLLWLGSAFDLTAAKIYAQSWLKQQSFLMGEILNDEYLRKLPSYIEEKREQIQLWSVPVMAFTLWILLLWGTGRLARRFLGPPFQHPRAALIFMQLHPRHIFLLIGWLILTILGSLSDQREFEVIAFPLILLIGTAGVAAGIGVILFQAALWGAQGRILHARLFLGAFILSLCLGGILALPFLAILGIADTWLDLRRLKKLAIPLSPE